MGIAERYFRKDGGERTAKSEVDTDPETSAVGAAVRGFAHEFSLGTADEIEASLKSIVSGNYEENIKGVRLLHKIAKKQHPGSYDGGEWAAIVSQVVPLVMSGVGGPGALARISAALGKKGFKAFVKESVPAGQRVVKALKKGRMGKSTKGITDAQKKIIKDATKKATSSKSSQRAVNELAEKALKKSRRDIAMKDLVKNSAKGLKYAVPMGAIEGWGKSEAGTVPGLLMDTVMGGGAGGLMAAAFPLFGSALRGGGQGLKYMGTKAQEMLSGLTEDQIFWLRKNPELFQNAKSFFDVEEHFKSLVKELVVAKNRISKVASKHLRSDKKIPREKIESELDALIEREKRILDPEDAGAVADNTRKFFQSMDDMKENILNRVGGDGISEKALNSLSQQYKAEAQKYVNPANPSYNEQVSKWLKFVRYNWKQNLADSNPGWNRAMEPVRKIMVTLGGDESIGKKGVYDVFGIKAKGDNIFLVEGATAKDTFLNRLLGPISAPFLKDGLRKFQNSRDLIDSVSELAHKHSPKYKKGPMGKQDVLKEGEAVVAQERFASGGNPETGAMNLWNNFFDEVGQKISNNRIVGLVTGIVGSTVRQKMGKRLMAEAITQKTPIPVKIPTPTGKMIQKAAPIATVRSGVGLSTSAISEQRPIEEQRRAVESIINEKRKKTEWGEEYGIPGFKGIKGSSDPVEIPMMRPDQPDQANLNDDDKEKQTREKNALRFLSQQKERSKPKYT